MIKLLPLRFRYDLRGVEFVQSPQPQAGRFGVVMPKLPRLDYLGVGSPNDSSGVMVHNRILDA